MIKINLYRPSLKDKIRNNSKIYWSDFKPVGRSIKQKVSSLLDKAKEKNKEIQSRLEKKKNLKKIAKEEVEEKRVKSIRHAPSYFDAMSSGLKAAGSAASALSNRNMSDVTDAVRHVVDMSNKLCGSDSPLKEQLQEYKRDLEDIQTKASYSIKEIDALPQTPTYDEASRERLQSIAQRYQDVRPSAFRAVPSVPRQYSEGDIVHLYSDRCSILARIDCVDWDQHKNLILHIEVIDEIMIDAFMNTSEDLESFSNKIKNCGSFHKTKYAIGKADITHRYQSFDELKRRKGGRVV